VSWHGLFAGEWVTKQDAAKHLGNVLTVGLVTSSLFLIVRGIDNASQGLTKERRAVDARLLLWIARLGKAARKSEAPTSMPIAVAQSIVIGDVITRLEHLERNVRSGGLELSPSNQTT
jgi:hypothetical protein